ncbi:hypothetical protein PG996_004413 [Apiospora saccharicola]|uniref:Uncharacterized protein n=1 Tax=Apiospora saccharicola TaxID=335842 RepID=A0ABR1W7V1_9PEZI
MQECVLKRGDLFALLRNCRILKENCFYAPEAATSTSWLMQPMQAPAYYEIVNTLRRSARDTLRYLDLDIGHFKGTTWVNSLDSDLAAMWWEIYRLPHV